MKNIRLICVTANNNNKFYNMSENSDGTFSVEYGRVDSTSRKMTYPMYKWDSIYSQKLAKGYRDVTALHAEESTVSAKKRSNDPLLAILYKLQDYANKVVRSNYNISSKAVTQGMINESQDILNSLANRISHFDGKAYSVEIEAFNQLLVQLFGVLPRKMHKVQDYLLSPELRAYDDIYHGMKHILSREQLMLDALSITAQTTTKEDDGEEKDDFMESLGIVLRPSDDYLVGRVKRHLGDISYKFSRCWYCTNTSAEKLFQDTLAKADNKKTHLFWHGSRNENWLSILKNSLMIRPTGVATTGSMFGDGIYFADRAKKSFGYTSGRGSYWAKGNSEKAYMALFQVHTGKQYKISRHSSECYRFSKSYLQHKGGYDSVYALKGADLRNDEFIVYDKAQCSIYALVELNG